MAGRKLIYIMGRGKSGSTLLAMLLNAHPDIVSIGEVLTPRPPGRRPSDQSCSCGAAICECPFWRRMVEEMGSRGAPLDLDDWSLTFRLDASVVAMPPADVGSSRPVRDRTHRLSRAQRVLLGSLYVGWVDSMRDRLVRAVPRWRARLEAVGRRNEAFVESVLAISGKSVFADATKDTGRVRFLLAHTDFDVHVVHLIRDAPGFASSMVKAGWSSLNDAVGLWNRGAAQSELIQALVPADHFQLVRYEDLSRDPVGTVTRITEQLGLARPPDPILFRDVPHHITGNKMRLSSSNEIRLDDSWRERLTPTEQADVLRRTRRVRARYAFAEDDPA